MNLYAVGKITGVFGLEGHLKVHPYSASPDRLKKLARVRVGKQVDVTTEYIVDNIVFKNRQWMLKLQDVSDRTLAEEIVGMFVFVNETEVETPAKGSYFSHEIIGCEVWSDEGQFIGTVEDIYSLATYDLWAVRTRKSVSMIPARKEFIMKVDIRRKKITVHLIEGLVEE